MTTANETMGTPQGIIRSQLETTTELPEARENVRHEAEIGLKICI